MTDVVAALFGISLGLLFLTIAFPFVYITFHVADEITDRWCSMRGIDPASGESVVVMSSAFVFLYALTAFLVAELIWVWSIL